MSLTAFCLVLIGALIHASWNIAAKKANGDIRFSFFSSVLMAIFWGPLVIWLGWDIVPTWGWKEWGFVWLSGFIHWVYFWCLLTGYRKSDFTVVYPLARGTGPLLSSSVAIVVFGERLAAMGVVGILGIAFGVFLIAGGPALFRAAHDPQKRERIMAGIGWGALTGVMIASYTVVDAYVVKVMALSPILFDYFANMTRLPLSALPVIRDPQEAWRQWKLQWPYALYVAVFSCVGYVLVLYAMKIAPVSSVAPAREMSMLFGALIGGSLLGEQDRALRIAGACAIAAGVILLVTSR